MKRPLIPTYAVLKRNLLENGIIIIFPSELRFHKRFLTVKNRYSVQLLPWSNFNPTKIRTTFAEKVIWDESKHIGRVEIDCDDTETGSRNFTRTHLGISISAKDKLLADVITSDAQTHPYLLGWSFLKKLLIFILIDYIYFNRLFFPDSTWNLSCLLTNLK